MKKQIFISHSAKDKKAIERFSKYFEDTGVKPVFMEYEKWSRNNKPNWQWIKNHIQESDAVFVILTKNVSKRKSTQNWVAFEIGIAAGCDPPKLVFLFRAEEKVDFPVPYLNHYFPGDITQLADYSKEFLSEEPSFPNVLVGLLLAILAPLSNNMLVELIKNPTLEPKELEVECYNCKTRFFYWNDNKDDFPCPCCSQKIIGELIKLD